MDDADDAGHLGVGHRRKQQLFDQPARAGSLVAAFVGALGEVDALDDAVLADVPPGEHPFVQQVEVDLKGRADGGRTFVTGVRGAEPLTDGVELQADRGVGRHARSAPDAHPTLDDLSQAAMRH
jgi:hypothetical protein